MKSHWKTPAYYVAFSLVSSIPEYCVVGYAMCTLICFCMDFGFKEISRVWELSNSLWYCSVCNSLDIKKRHGPIGITI